MYSKAQSSWGKHLDFIVIDLLCLQISYTLSYVIWSGLSLPYAVPIYLRIALLLSLLDICIVFFTESYSGILRRGYLKECKAVIRFNTILLASIVFYMFIIKKSGAYSRLVIFTFAGVNSVIMYSAHVAIKRLHRLKIETNKNYEYLLLVTKKSLVQASTEKLLCNEFGNQKLKGIVIIDENMTGSEVMGIPVVASYYTMMEYARTNVVDQVLIHVRDPRIEDVANQFIAMGITVHINIDRISSNFPNTVLEKVNGYTVITTSINIVTVRQLFIKRAADICGGLAMLLATGAAFIIFAPIIYIQSPGPIFFSHYRVGTNGRQFRIYKFRSMYMDAEAGKKKLMGQNKMTGLMFKMDNDPRVTPIGRFLRKTSIDELPQSLNILRGDMSLVGTRPPTVDEYEQYQFHHKSRLAAKPGLTGMWQVSGRSDITDFEEVVKLDNEYIKNWTLGLDLKIMFKTVGVVLGRVGSA